MLKTRCLAYEVKHRGLWTFLISEQKPTYERRGVGWPVMTFHLLVSNIQLRITQPTHLPPTNHVGSRTKVCWKLCFYPQMVVPHPRSLGELSVFEVASCSRSKTH